MPNPPAEHHGVYDDEAGWGVLPELLSPREVMGVREICDGLLRLPASQQRARDKVAAGTLRLSELDDRSEVIDEIVGRRSLSGIIEHILGPGFRRDQVEYRSPQPSFGGQKLHADDPPKLDNGPATVATAIVALTDFTATNGATRLIPGSHRRHDLQRLAGSLDAHDDEISLTGVAGTAFVFSGHVLHSGTTNRSDTPRPALQLVWRR